MPNGDYQLVGFSQGLFSVETDANTWQTLHSDRLQITNESERYTIHYFGPHSTLLTPDGAQVTIAAFI